MKCNMKIKAIVIVSSLRMLLIFLMLNKYHLDEVLFVFNEDFELHKKYKIKHYVAIKKENQDVVPSELFELLDVNFERVITLFSTAVFKYDRNIVDFYGTRIHDKIYQWFGDIKF